MIEGLLAGLRLRDRLASLSRLTDRDVGRLAPDSSCGGQPFVHQTCAKVCAEAVPGFRLTVAPEISAATASMIASDVFMAALLSDR